MKGAPGVALFFMTAINRAHEAHKGCDLDK